MSQFKKKLTTFGALLAFLSISAASMQANAFTDFNAGEVINKTNNLGIDTINKANGGLHTDINMNTNQAGAVGQFDASSFNIAKDSDINIGYAGLSQTIIGRVLGGEQSKIFGRLTDSCAGGAGCTSYGDTGKFVLINPAGVLFGAGSQVDMNSLTVSTFDFNGAKNLKNMSAEEMNAYQTGVLNKLSPVAAVNGEGRNYGDINFDSNYISGFQLAGVSYNPGNTNITFDGADVYVDKSFNAVSDNIAYTDSIIRTAGNYNYITPNASQSFSNVRLVTGDGVTFRYKANGYSNNYKVADDTKNVERNIKIDNSGLLAKDPTKVAIQTGDLHIVNGSKAAGSNVKISNSIVKATKLVNAENGDILITSLNDVDIENSRLQTVNTIAAADKKSTVGQSGGEIYISAGKNANVKNSLLMSAGTSSTNANANSGAVRIISTGNANVDGSKILSEGDAKVKASNKTTINNSLISASNTTNKSIARNAIVSGSAGGVEIKNSIIDATGDVDVISQYSDKSLANNIVISSDPDANGMNQTVVSAGGKLSIQGKNTKVDNASLAYKELKFYGDGTTGTNNVTIANNTTFTPVKVNADGSKTVGSDVNIETNGNLTFDNATAKRAAYSLNFVRTTDGNVYDDGTVNAVDYSHTLKTANAVNLNAKSTQGNVNIQNGSNIKTTKDMTFTSDNKNVNFKDSTLNAGQNIKIEATKGSVLASNNATATAGNDLNVISYNTITFGKSGDSNTTIDSTVDLNAGHNMNIVSTNGDINGEKTTMPTLEYGNRLTFNAKGDNTFTSEDSLKSVNVDYIAGGANKFYTKSDIQFVNSSFEAPENFIESGHDVILNDLTIKSATANAKDTVTQIFANGNVTTNDVTGTAKSDVLASTKSFPQSVSTDRTGTDKTTLDVGKTKLKITTEVVKDPQNPSNGSITLNVKNADNSDAGIELTAQNVAKLDKDPTGGHFRKGYYLSGEQKWDENIKPNEGPEVRIDADDNKLAISKIITDKLHLSDDDKFYASDANLTPDQIASLPEGTPSKGYIEVRDQGGFNFDNNKGYDPSPDKFDYTGNFDSHDTNVEGGIPSTTTKVSDVYVIKKEYVKDNKGNTIATDTTYGQDTTKTTTTTDRITTTTDKKHTIKFDNDGNPSDFILVYDKTSTKTEKFPPKTETSTKTWVERENCPPAPDVDKDTSDLDSYINVTKLPKEQVEVSKTSKVADNTIDQTSNIMSAAAKVDLSGEEDVNGNSKDDEE